MKKLSLLALLAAGLSLTSFAQNKLLTLDDIFNPDAAKRVQFGGRPVAVQWASDGRSFKQIEECSGKGCAPPVLDSEVYNARFAWSFRLE